MSDIQLPSELQYLSSIIYDELNPFDYGTFSFDDALAGFFYVTRTARRRGKGGWQQQYGGPKTQPEAQRVAASLLARCVVQTRGEGPWTDVLAEWLTASVLRLSERGAPPPVAAMRPLHFLSYRADLPSRWANLRSLPEFLTVVLQRDPSKGAVEGEGSDWFAVQSHSNLFWQAFGGGLRNDHPGALQAVDLDSYDDQHLLDIDTLLAVRVVDKLKAPFPVTGGKGNASGQVRGLDLLCPFQAHRFREDFSNFLRAYRPPTVPVAVLGDYVTSLLSLNTTTFLLSHVAAANRLYATGTLDAGQSGASLDMPCIYADVTDGAVRGSERLARASYERHHMAMAQHVRVILGFRLLDRYLQNMNYLPALKGLKDLHGRERLVALAQARLDQASPIHLAVQMESSNLLSALEKAQPDGWPSDLLPVASSGDMPPLDKLTEILATSRDYLTKHVMPFFTLGCCRRNLPTGLLRGAPQRRDVNHFTLGLQMLETLVQLFILKPGNPPKARPLDIYHFVDTLKERYGIWIDEPPPGLDDSLGARQAAQANFDALKEKLRQLGFFRAVSDARRMQRLTPRYQPVGKHTEEEAVNEPVA